MTQISPLQPTPTGAFRFNTDSMMLEYYQGNQWVNITSDTPHDHTGVTRGISMAGGTPSYVNTIQYFNISTMDEQKCLDIYQLY